MEPNVYNDKNQRITKHRCHRQIQNITICQNITKAKSSEVLHCDLPIKSHKLHTISPRNQFRKKVCIYFGHQ